jgi:hypothetical protein
MITNESQRFPRLLITFVVAIRESLSIAFYCVDHDDGLVRSMVVIKAPVALLEYNVIARCHYHKLIAILAVVRDWTPFLELQQG